jgi:hypothetical protein
VVHIYACTNNLGDRNCVWISFKLVSHIFLSNFSYVKILSQIRRLTGRFTIHQYFLMRIYSTRTITRRRSQGPAPGLSLSIIVTLLSMCGTKTSQGMTKNINMTMNGGQIRFYLRIYCRTLGILWYMYK